MIMKTLRSRYCCVPKIAPPEERTKMMKKFLCSGYLLVPRIDSPEARIKIVKKNICSTYPCVLKNQNHLAGGAKK